MCQLFAAMVEGHPAPELACQRVTDINGLDPALFRDFAVATHQRIVKLVQDLKDLDEAAEHKSLELCHQYMAFIFIQAAEFDPSLRKQLRPREPGDDALNGSVESQYERAWADFERGALNLASEKMSADLARRILYMCNNNAFKRSIVSQRFYAGIRSNTD